MFHPSIYDHVFICQLNGRVNKIVDNTLRLLKKVHFCLRSPVGNTGIKRKAKILTTPMKNPPGQASIH